MFIEDYHGTMHPIRPCPVCGGQPERDDCGPERQAVMCWRCGTYADTYDEIGTNAMLIEAIKIWNSGKEWENQGMEGMVKFDESKILTAVTADQAKVGDVGWFGDSVDELRLAITSEMEKPSELKLIDSDSCQYRFSDGPEDYSLFYPAPYSYLQEQWVKEDRR